MLIGEPGVGKTAIAEGVARRLGFEPDTIPVRRGRRNDRERRAAAHSGGVEEGGLGGVRAARHG
jgi:ATPase family associated with various cellular activities (AAA)